MLRSRWKKELKLEPIFSLSLAVVIMMMNIRATLEMKEGIKVTAHILLSTVAVITMMNWEYKGWSYGIMYRYVVL